MTDEKDSLPPLTYTFSDRALDDDPSPWDITSSDTIDLIGYWRQIQKDKSFDRVDSPEWKSLETSYLAHLKWRFDYPRKIAAQQIAFTWIMTFLVFVLVIAGLIFSFIQLNHALTIGNLDQTITEFEIDETAGKLSFQSSVIGAAVLIISLVFYYLYLQFVFSAKTNKPLHLSLYSTDAPRLFGKRKYMPRRRRTYKKANGEKTP